MTLIEFKTYLFHSNIERHKEIKNQLLDLFKTNKERSKRQYT